MSGLLYPRLPASVADALVDERMGQPLGELAELAGTSFPLVVYGATGGTKASEAHLSLIRETLMATASDHGYPRQSRPTDLVSFDRSAARALFGVSELIPAEAAVPGMWDFLAIVLLPDIVAWRFPGANRERWRCNDRTRHTFARLWWQAFLLAGEERTAGGMPLLDALSESDLNQIFERRSLSQNSRTTRAVAAAYLECREKYPRVSPRSVLRDVAPRLLRLRWFISMDSLSDSRLHALFARLFEESARGVMALPETVEDAEVILPEEETESAEEQIEEDPLASYDEHDGRDIADPRTCTWEDLVRSVVAVVDVEGPVHARRVFRVIADAVGIRLTTRVVGYIVEAIRRASNEGHIVVEGQRGPEGFRGAILRLPRQPDVRLRQLGPREVTEVPPAEAAALMLQERRKNPMLSDAQLARELAKRWGINRVTDRFRADVARLIARAGSS
jgi:hypothetical protein